MEVHAPQVMGVVNVTPDSFSDGGRYAATQEAVAHGLRLLEEGADILDIGGESTRPGAEAVPEQQEADRVIPVIEGLRQHCSAPISVDTSKPNLMRAAVCAGATMVNDVNALREPGALETLAQLDVTVCLMHMQGRPRTMQNNPQYADVVGEVCDFLRQRIDQCVRAGISANRLVVDPGFGFGKTLEHNLLLLAAIPRLKSLGHPVLVGLSRKSMFGDLLGLAVDKRAHASTSAAAIAVLGGADIVRAHDVEGTVHAVRLAAEVRDRISPDGQNFAN